MPRRLPAASAMRPITRAVILFSSSLCFISFNKNRGRKGPDAEQYLSPRSRRIFAGSRLSISPHPAAIGDLLQLRAAFPFQLIVRFFHIPDGVQPALPR